MLGPRCHTDLAWDVVGLIPVQVAEGPRNTRAAWRIYLAELFGTAPNDRWQMFPKLNHDLFEMLDWTYKQWACTVPDYLSPDLAMMLVPLGRPRKVVASGCRACAPPDSWVLTLPDLIVTSEPVGQRVVWSAPEVTQVGSYSAANSHLTADDYQRLTEGAFQTLRAEATTIGEEGFYEDVTSADDYLNVDPDGYSEMLDQVVEQALADVASAHDWWRLTTEVSAEIESEVETCLQRVSMFPAVWDCNLAMLISAGLALMEGR